MESLLSRQGTDPERFPPSPHKPGLGALGTARVEPSCSLIPCQGRAVFIFGNVKAGEEVIKLKKPACFRELGPGKRCGPGVFLAAGHGHGHGPAAAAAHPEPRLEQEAFP